MELVNVSSMFGILLMISMVYFCHCFSVLLADTSELSTSKKYSQTSTKAFTGGVEGTTFTSQF